MTPLSAIPTPNDLDADYSPAFIKLARLLRDQIRSGEYKCGDELPPSNSLAQDHGISRRTVLHALEVLAANKYITRTSDFRPYKVIWTPPQIRMSTGVYVRCDRVTVRPRERPTDGGHAERTAEAGDL